MHKILFFEDDTNLASLIAQYLERHHFTTQTHPNGNQAIEYIQQYQPDLILLDIMLPDSDGIALCKTIRPYFTGPIVMFTSIDSDINQILSLESGANDFVLKTAQPAVLLARLRNQLRQPSSTLQQQSLYTFGSLSIDINNRSVIYRSQNLLLSTAEFNVLQVLCQHAGQILSRETLFKKLNKTESVGIDRSIDITISRLRKKLGDDPHAPQLIKTIRNRGYLFAQSGWV